MGIMNLFKSYGDLVEVAENMTYIVLRLQESHGSLLKSRAALYKTAGFIDLWKYFRDGQLDLDTLCETVDDLMKDLPPHGSDNDYDEEITLAVIGMIPLALFPMGRWLDRDRARYASSIDTLLPAINQVVEQFKRGRLKRKNLDDIIVAFLNGTGMVQVRQQLGVVC